MLKLLKKEKNGLLPINKKTIGVSILLIMFIAGSMTIDPNTSDSPINSFIEDVVDGFSNIWQIDQVSGETYDTSQGSFTLDSVPTVSSVQFVDSAYALTSTLIPDDSTIFGINFSVSFPAGMDDLHNITIDIFDDSLHGSDYASDDPNGYQHVRVTWTESTDVWAIDQNTLAQWTEQSSIDPGIANAATSFDFCFRFDMSKITRADSDWNCTVFVYDEDTPADSDGSAETGLVTVSNYFQTDFDSATFSWGTVASNTDNATHAPLSINVIANAQWELLINATDFNATGESDVDIEANDIICIDADGSANGESYWIRNTIAVVVFTTWDNVAPLTTESATNLNVYILLSTANLFDAGSGKTWSTWVTVWCQANT